MDFCEISCFLWRKEERRELIESKSFSLRKSQTFDGSYMRSALAAILCSIDTTLGEDATETAVLASSAAEYWCANSRQYSQKGFR
ncbi:hypothetical protein PoB_007548500 [Plakobranchus ocellatus]|uniref:Uncharacterized protein n=1 Tax=Plakobranchus ocellatus TaxID=259542 RepID=A0AAV4DYA0_9GAST|nr:hypothetical protein PoB_007548500 [Plakobranchus ocellatus]